MTNWNVGQKVVGLYNIGILNYDGTWLGNLIELDKVYEIISIEKGCCMSLLNVGKTYKHNGNEFLHVTCEKCKIQYLYEKWNEILCNEEWFSPIDENESIAAKAAKKHPNNFPKSKNHIVFLKE